MTTQIPATLFPDPAPAQSLERAAAALTAHGFTVEILDDAAAARTRVQELIPEGACVFTGASETLRLSGIEADINASGRYQAVRPRVLAMDRGTQADEIRQLTASPDVVMGSVAAVTETGSLVVASASGSQLPAYSAPAPRWPTGCPAPSTACSSSTRNTFLGAAPSCCFAKPSDSETGRSHPAGADPGQVRSPARMR